MLSASQQRVVAAVQANKSIFFTGVAGSGKSFLLKYLRNFLPVATTFYTASTGLAAVDISGTTLHAFAGIGLGNEPVEDLVERVRRRPDARRRWQACKVLVVDEISMIDASLFDKLEHIARCTRRSDKPFGNVQLVLCGDFLQLPPVGPQKQFCFESTKWKRCVPLVIELAAVFRQTDAALVTALGSVRRGLTDTLDVFVPCIGRVFPADDGILPTRLYATRAEVAHENDERLRQIDAPAIAFSAVDFGKTAFVEQLKKNCPAPERLVLKVGAQVLLIKNLSVEEGLVNGSRGIVTDLAVVPATSTRSACTRPKVRFINGLEKRIDTDEWDIQVGGVKLATRQQLPLILAWSLTIHKCQGMTLDRVSLRLESVFENGMTYVALSRCRSLESLRIEGAFPALVVKAHPAALAFYDQLAVPPPAHTGAKRKHDDILQTIRSPSTHDARSRPLGI